jgi:CelD/BcsL family acetyltransferase involved in cellulose biosynthesis
MIEKGGSRWRGEVRPIGDLGPAEIASWRQLTAACHEFRSPFFSLEFARAVAQSGARARVCLLYDNGILAGFFPFQFSGRVTQSMAAGERIGGTLNDFSGVLIDRSRHGPISYRELLSCAQLASFEASHLEQTQALLGLRAGGQSAGARINIQDSPDHYWEGVRVRHPGYYKTFRGQERKAKRIFHSVDFTFSDQEVGSLLKRVIAEKRDQYKRSGAQDGLADPHKIRCLDHISRYQEGGCLPVMSILYFDGEWAAIDFGLRAGRVLHAWFPVYNQKYRQFSPGLMLFAAIIREATSHGIDELDLGQGLSPYKELFATELYPIYSDVWCRLQPRGLAYRGYLSLLWRMHKFRNSRSLHG